jgi:threonine 3-dehydrogenase
MKILITGANGQIGASLLTTLVARGHEVVATDINLPGQGSARPGTWRHLDVRDRQEVDAVVAESAPDAVFHLAAILSARGEKSPHLTYEVNQSGTYYLLEACRQHGARQFMFTSSIAVYGPGLPDPTPDDVPLHPTTMYGVTKIGGELLCEYYRQRHGMDVRGLRFPGLISAELPGGGTSDYALYMFTEGIRVGHYQAFCRPDTRIPLMYMPDGVRALIELFSAPRQRLRRCIYNVAAFSPTASEIAAAASRAIGDVSITFAPDPMRQAILDSWPRSLDDSLARLDWSWRATYDLDAMTADLVPALRALVAEHAEALKPADIPPSEPTD